MKKGNKGFSFVELICTIAIFSIIITGVGTAMVVSARSYQNGNVELDLQQQAQITSNLLTNLIIDSDRVVQASGSTLIVEKLESGDTVTYQVYLDGGTIKYVTSRDATEHILAENVTGFTVKQDTGNNVDFELKFADERGVRSYESDYHVTPRNGIMSGGAAMSGTATLFVENKVILEPGQTYDLNVRVLGTSVQEFTTGSLSGNTDTVGTTAVALDKNTVRITVGLGETSNEFHFDIIPNDTSVASQNVDVFVRRVNAINVNGYKTGGTVNKAGASYKVTAPLAGTPYLDKEPGAWYDIDYVNPYTVEWSFEFTKDSASLNAMDYIEITDQGTEGNVPYITFKLKQKLTEGCSLRVVGTALHPEGIPAGSAYTNKSGLKYGTVSGYWDLDYQAWKRNGKLDIAIHHLDDENFWFWDGNIMYKWNARVKFTAYDTKGNLSASIHGDFDPWQREQHLPIKADLDLNNIRDQWDLTLLPYHETNNVWDWGPSYSLPYILAYYHTPEGGFNRNFYVYNANPYFVNTGLEVAGYNIELYYEYLDENGNLTSETVYENYEVEEVSVLYKNALDTACAWQRDNKIFVTTADTITDYKVHFQFDRGWDEDDHDYFFADMKRFVGVVTDKPGYLYDVRRDITVSGNEKKKGVPDGDSVLTFTLTAADKAECKALADKADGTITVIYEYDPFLGRLPRVPKTENELRAENPGWTDYNFWTNSEISADPLNPRWYNERAMPMNVGGVTLTQDLMDSIKGCEGHVVFCFKDPNITGAALKAMYCPTLTEYGPLYYIDDTSRFSIDVTTAQYQELIGGTWSTVVNLVWNGSGWTAN